MPSRALISCLQAVSRALCPKAAGRLYVRAQHPAHSPHTSHAVQRPRMRALRTAFPARSLLMPSQRRCRRAAALRSSAALIQYRSIRQREGSDIPREVFDKSHNHQARSARCLVIKAVYQL